MALFGHFKQKPLFNDPFFGELRFYEAKAGSFFGGRRAFAPLGRDLEFLIRADESGPLEAQREFYRTLERDYELLKEKMRPFIEGEFRNWRDDFRIEDFDREFTLVHLSIPRPEPQPRKWELSFTTLHDAEHQITIEFEEWEATGILIDG